MNIYLTVKRSGVPLVLRCAPAKQQQARFSYIAQNVSTDTEKSETVLLLY